MFFQNSIGRDVEINLEDKPKFRLNSDSVTAPTGPNASLINAKITSNPKVHFKVDKVVSDIHLKSVEGLKILYEKGVENYDLTKILSVGNLGVEKNRKLVPTRWSITAVHDTLGKLMTTWIKSYNCADYQYFFGGYLGNYFVVMLFPDVWGFELFETYTAGSLWNPSGDAAITTDHEFYDGRKSYAENCSGGYYACRFAVLERLKSMKKQARVIVLRFITNEYSAPLGVWVVQEAAKKAVHLDAMPCSSEEDMINSVKDLVRRRFHMNADKFFSKSRLLDEMRSQSKLNQFF